MSFIKTRARSKIHINLMGPDGNAFVLLGIVSKLIKTLNPSDSKGVYSAFHKTATKGDYIDLLLTIENQFGEYFEFEADDELLDQIKDRKAKNVEASKEKTEATPEGTPV